MIGRTLKWGWSRIRAGLKQPLSRDGEWSEPSRGRAGLEHFE